MLKIHWKKLTPDKKMQAVSCVPITFTKNKLVDVEEETINTDLVFSKFLSTNYY